MSHNVRTPRPSLDPRIRSEALHALHVPRSIQSASKNREIFLNLLVKTSSPITYYLLLSTLYKYNICRSVSNFSSAH